MLGVFVANTTQTQFTAVEKDVNGNVLMTLVFYADDIAHARQKMKEITNVHSTRGVPTNTWTISYQGPVTTVAYP